MTVKEAIEKAKDRKPNAFPDEELIDWLNEFEARVQVELMQIAPEAVVSYDLADDAEKAMLLPKPFESMYVDYICMMIQFNQEEWTAYNNTSLMLNASFNEAQKYYNSKYPKTDNLKIRNWAV